MVIMKCSFGNLVYARWALFTENRGAIIISLKFIYIEKRKVIAERRMGRGVR